MSKKKDKKMTFGEAIKINLRSFKLLYDKMPSMYIAKIIGIVWSALTPLGSPHKRAVRCERPEETDHSCCADLDFRRAHHPCVYTVQ